MTAFGIEGNTEKTFVKNQILPVAGLSLPLMFAVKAAVGAGVVFSMLTVGAILVAADNLFMNRNSVVNK